MTRNNLADHLPWLLNNLALPKPSTLTFPSASDGSQSGPSQSQSYDSEAQEVGSETIIDLEDGPFPTHPAPNRSNGLGQTSTALRDTDQVILVEDTMARLTSSVKSKKPSLVSKPQQQLLTPASTKHRSLQPDTQVKRDTGKHETLPTCLLSSV